MCDYSWLEEKLICGAHQTVARGLRWEGGWGIECRRGIWRLRNNATIFPTAIFILDTRSSCKPSYEDAFTDLCSTLYITTAILSYIHSGISGLQSRSTNIVECNVNAIAMKVRTMFKDLYVWY